MSNLSIVGFHVIGPVGNQIDAISAIKPSLVLLLDPAAGAVAAVKQASPNTRVIGRVFKPDSEVAGQIEQDPIAAADWAFDILKPHIEANPAADWWQIANEVQQVEVAQIVRNAMFHRRLIDRLATIGARATIAGFSRGVPKTIAESPAHWGAYFDVMRYAKERGGLLLIHQYGYAPVNNDASWLLRRYEERVQPFLPDDLRDMPWACGEWGSDMGHQRQGWKTGYQLNAQRYVDDMHAAATATMQTDAGKYCVGLCIFTAGRVNNDWIDFEIDGDVMGRIVNRSWPQAHVSSPPSSPNTNVDEWAMRRGREIATISVAPGTALFDGIIRDGWLPNSPEVYEHGPDGRLYALRSGESPDGQRKATYFALSGDWGNVRKLEV